MTNHANALANVADAATGAVGIATLVGYLPDIAAGLTILWYLARFAAWARAALIRVRNRG